MRRSVQAAGPHLLDLVYGQLFPRFRIVKLVLWFLLNVASVASIACWGRS